MKPACSGKRQHSGEWRVASGEKEDLDGAAGFGKIETKANLLSPGPGLPVPGLGVRG